MSPDSGGRIVDKGVSAQIQLIPQAIPNYTHLKRSKPIMMSEQIFQILLFRFSFDMSMMMSMLSDEDRDQRQSKPTESK